MSRFGAWFHQQLRADNVLMKFDRMQGRSVAVNLLVGPAEHIACKHQGQRCAERPPELGTRADSRYDSS